MFDSITKICTIAGLFPICTDITVRTKPFFIIFRFYTQKIKGKPLTLKKSIFSKPSTEKLVWPWKKGYCAQPASKHKSALKATRRPAPGKHYNLKMHAKGPHDCCVTRLVEMQTEPQPRWHGIFHAKPNDRVFCEQSNFLSIHTEANYFWSSVPIKVKRLPSVLGLPI